MCTRSNGAAVRRTYTHARVARRTRGDGTFCGKHPSCKPPSVARGPMKKSGISKKALSKKKPSGIGLLDGIMSSVTQLHSSLPTRPRGSAALEEEEVASPYMISKGSMASTMSGAAGAPGVQGREVCKNTHCGRSEFEVDARQGNRICVHCGVVQNTRSLESQEEEHRTFADDDKSEGKKRAEVQHDGKVGGLVGESLLAKAQALANSGGVQAGELMEKDDRKLECYRQQVRALASVMELSTNAVVASALDVCERYVLSVVAHGSMCKTGSKCRCAAGGGRLDSDVVTCRPLPGRPQRVASELRVHSLHPRAGCGPSARRHSSPHRAFESACRAPISTGSLRSWPTS